MNLSINPEDIKANGENICNKGAEFKSLLDSVKAANDELKQSWAGSDAQSYINKVAEQAAQLEALLNTINEIGNTMQRIGQTYINVRNNNTI